VATTPQIVAFDGTENPKFVKVRFCVGPARTANMAVAVAYILSEFRALLGISYPNLLPVNDRLPAVPGLWARELVHCAFKERTNSKENRIKAMLFRSEYFEFIFFDFW
jgi:hypothetical protein